MLTIAFDRLRLVGAALLVAILASCGPEPPKQPDPTIAQVTLEAGGGANPNVAGQPSPTVVFIYALKPGAPFETAASEALLGGELGELAQSMTRIARIVIAPGKERKEIFQLPDDTARIGVAGMFRQFDTAAWRSLAPVTANSVTLLTATVGANTIEIK